MLLITISHNCIEILRHLLPIEITIYHVKWFDHQVDVGLSWIVVKFVDGIIQPECLYLFSVNNFQRSFSLLTFWRRSFRIIGRILYTAVIMIYLSIDTCHYTQQPLYHHCITININICYHGNEDASSTMVVRLRLGNIKSMCILWINN